MGRFQRMFDKMLHESISEKKLVLSYCKKQLRKFHIELTDEQIVALEERINKSLLEEEASIEIEDFLPEGFDSEQLLAELENEGSWDNFVSDLSSELQEGIRDLMEDGANSISETLRRTAPEMLEETRQIRREFEGRLMETWGKSLNSLEVLIRIATECGETFNKEWRTKAVEDQNLVFDVLTRLHARGCQVAQEVLVLLKGGFADGAHARWRTLHEITTVAMFIADKGNDMANRYLLHNDIESYKAILQQAEHAVPLGLTVEQSEIEWFKRKYDGLIAQFGPDYRHEYGWAAHALSKGRPNFLDIEQAVSLEHLRPYYKLASHNVHANPKGALFKLGLLAGGPVLLAGASNAGLADPGQLTAISLNQLTLTLLHTKSEIDTVISMKILASFSDECKDAFMDDHWRFQEEVKRQKEQHP